MLELGNKVLDMGKCLAILNLSNVRIINRIPDILDTLDRIGRRDGMLLFFAQVYPFTTSPETQDALSIPL